MSYTNECGGIQTKALHLNYIGKFKQDKDKACLVLTSIDDEHYVHIFMQIEKARKHIILYNKLCKHKQKKCKNNKCATFEQDMKYWIYHIYPMFYDSQV